MSLRVKFWSVVIVVHGIILYLVYHVLKDTVWLFFIFELIVLCSLYSCYAIFNALVRPLELMQIGGMAMKDRDFNTHLLPTGSKEADQLIEVFNKMMDKLGEERNKAENQNIFLDLFFKTAPIGIIILDFDGYIDLINNRAMQLLEYQHSVKIKLKDRFPKLYALLNQSPFGDSNQIRYHSSKTFRIHTGKLIHQGFLKTYLVIEDLTSELLQSEKEAYGKIIRMMAHEVNNSMGAVNSIIQTTMYSDALQEDQDLTEGLEVAYQRNQKLTAFMNNFAHLLRIQKPSVAETDIMVFLESMTKLWRLKCAEHNIELKVKPSPTIFLNIDVIQMEQVMTNLIKNAIEAITNGGRIELGILDSQNGWYIADSGHGLEPDYEANAHRPFFSTKPGGQGVGLMICREIIYLHKADYRFYNDTFSRMTRFDIMF